MRLNVLALAFMAAALGGSLLIGSALAARPNILIIVGDDMGYADIGVHGCKDIPTPHIDSLAASGVRCTSGYVSGPYCSPTRAGLMTGRYQQRFGHEFNPGPNPMGDIGLPLTEVTLADRLKAAGYKTGMVGKWHLGDAEKFHPVNRGFAEYYGFLGGARSFFPITPNVPPVGGRMYRNLEVLPENEPYTTDTFAREATAFIDRHAKDEWFLYLTFNAVHTPMHATEKYLSRFKNVEPEGRRTYCAMMSAMDDAIGAVLARLDESKLTENTLIFFVSDNGGPPVNSSSNGVLRGNKAQTWEGGIRVPYLVQWKGRIPAGKTYDNPVIQLDFHPTALSAAGVEAKDAKFDGVNLLPHLEGKVTMPPHDTLYWRFGDQMAIRHGNLKLVQGRGADRRMLFDLAADIGEQKDLAAERPDAVKDLTARYDAWNATLEQPRWGQPNRALGTFKNKAKAGGKKKKAKAVD
ncbi:MAG: sulfatase-like hydrolase/transferase [Planctomycetaceae bacterium]|nr:sulfatase-like hydrolase/transferase [Planctomycetaceae bacterium]